MKKWFDTDTFREILDSILRNKSRSILTGFGVFWGIFMLMLLTGGSQGLKDLLNKNFEGFAQNTCIAFSNSTSKPFKGFKKGRTWEMTYSDVDRLRNLMPELETVTPTVGLWGKSVTRDENSSSEAVVRGARADYVNIETPQMMYGRYLNEADVAQERKVCVLGKKVYADLFPEGGDPCGKRICISGSYYNVIGVDWREGGGIQINGSNSDLVTIPLTQAIKAYNLGNTIQLLCFTAKPGYTMSDLTPRVREILARAHYFDPTDEQALFLLNTQLIFGIVDNLFKGINFLVWLIGEGAHHRDWHPPRHWRYAPPDSGPDYFREHRAYAGGRHGRHCPERTHPGRRGDGNDRGRHSQGCLPGTLRNSHAGGVAPDCTRRRSRPHACLPRHADQTRRCNERRIKTNYRYEKVW